MLAYLSLCNYKILDSFIPPTTLKVLAHNSSKYNGEVVNFYIRHHQAVNRIIINMIDPVNPIASTTIEVKWKRRSSKCKRVQGLSCDVSGKKDKDCCCEAAITSSS